MITTDNGSLGQHRPTGQTPRARTMRARLFTATHLIPVAVLSLATASFSMPAAHAQTPPAADTTAAPSGPASPSPAASAPAPVAGASSRPVRAQVAPGPSSAIAVLLQQANYWHNQTQYEQAIESLNRALALEPKNADALALLGQIQAERGKRAEAQAALAQLKTIAPDDPRIAKIDQTVRVGPISQDALADARRLAREGRQAEAITRYDSVFKGTAPPDNYAVEFYQTLAGTDGGWQQAKNGLERVVRQNPQDLRAQLAYAQILTYRDATRVDGVARLSNLARNPSVADQATTAWKQALEWLPENKSSLEPLTVYLNAHPNDTAVANKLESVKNPHPDANDPGALDRQAGFDALNSAKLPAAASAFQKALDTNDKDSDALGGLGIVKLRQKQFNEAKSLLGRAIALDPDHKGRWQQAFDGANLGLNPPRGPAGPSGPNGAVEAARAQAMITRGDYPGAERVLLREIARGADNSGGLQSMLADAQSHQGRLGDAEASFRDALRRNPKQVGALVGLAGILSREGRSEEAQGLLERADAAGGGKLVGQARALALRERAQGITDPRTQVALYREAVSLDPSNPWTKLDLARSLTHLNQLSAARQVMSGLVGRDASTDGLKAAILFANETNDPDAAAALVNRLPPSERTTEMRVLQANASLQRDIGRAMVLSSQMARQRLLAMAASPDPDGSRGAAIARALGRIGDRAGAREAIVMAQNATQGASPGASLAYAAALLDIGAPNAAEQELAQVDPAGLAPAQRRSYSQMTAGLAVRTADQLNDQGKQAEAYDRLAPALAQTPDSPDLNMALARLYQGAHDSKQAMAINDALLRRDPRNPEIRRAAIDAAIASGDRSRADALVNEGLQITPNDPRMWVASADLAKARGLNGKALRDLSRARDLRLQQLGYGDTRADGDANPISSLSLSPGASFQQISARPSGLSAPGFGGLRSVTQGNADGGDDDSTQPWYTQTGPQAPRGIPAFGQSPYSPAASAATESVSYAQAAPSYPPRPFALDTSATDLPPPSPGRPTPLATYAQASTPYQPPSHPPAPFVPADAPPATLPPRDLYAPEQRGVLPQYQPYQPTTGQQPFAPPQPPAQDMPAAATQRYGEPPSVLNAQSGGPVGGPVGYYSNPFRSGGSRAMPGDISVPNASALGQPDPMTEQIDRDIAQLRDTTAPSFQGGFAFRQRSGDSGLDSLTELSTPIEAQFSPGGYGKITVSATPTFLNSGTIAGDATNLGRFGTSALGLKQATPASNFVATYAGKGPGDQFANGVGLSAGFAASSFNADVGTTPLGFLLSSVVGGAQFTPQLTDGLRLNIVGERRAMTDSVLSYAGTADARTGVKWGGVTRTRGRANLEYSFPSGGYIYAGAGYGRLTGTHVLGNSEVEAGAGASFPVWKSEGREVRVGLDLVYFGYDKNLRFFTLGQGGYFSPQSYFAALVPVTYKQQVNEDLSYEVGAAVGFQNYHENSSPYYPRDPALQAQLEASQASPATAVTGLQTNYAAQSKSGFAGNAHAQVDYRVTPSLHVGARVGALHAGNFTEASGLAYAKYIFNGADKK